MSDSIDTVISALLPGISTKELAVVLISGCALALLVFQLTKIFHKETIEATSVHSSSLIGHDPATDNPNAATPITDRRALSTLLEEPEVTSHSNESTTPCQGSLCCGILRFLVSSLFDSCLSKLRLMKGTNEICLNDFFHLPCKDSVSLRIFDVKLLNKPTFEDVEVILASPPSITFKGKASFSLRLDVMLSSAKLIQDKMLPLSLDIKNLSSGVFHLTRENDDLIVEAEDDIGTAVDGASLSLRDFLLRDERVIALANLADIPLTFRFQLIEGLSRNVLHDVMDSWQHLTSCPNAILDNEKSEPSPSDLAPTVAEPLVDELLPNGEAQVTVVSTAGEQIPVTEPVLVVGEQSSPSGVARPQMAGGERLVLCTPQDVIHLVPRKVVFAGGVWKEIDGTLLGPLETSQSAPDEWPQSTLAPAPAFQHVEEDLNPLTESKGEETNSHPAQEGDSSSLSGISGISGSSTRTYLGEASTLVIETVTNGIVEHYLIPHGLADYSKLKKHGKKLHLFQDHAFVARHLPGGTKCGACGKSVGRLPPPIKQGYECRFCHLRCHKHCHVKLETYCPNSKAMEMELKYPRVNPDGKLEF